MSVFQLTRNSGNSGNKNKMMAEDIARAISEMRYEDLLKIGEQLKIVVTENNAPLCQLHAHDWVALVHAWSKVCLEKPVMDIAYKPSAVDNIKPSSYNTTNGASYSPSYTDSSYVVADTSNEKSS